MPKLNDTRQYLASPKLSPGKSDGVFRQIIGAILSATLLILSFPNFDYSFLAWVALAPLIQVIANGVSPRRAFLLGWLCGVTFMFFAENWIAHSMTNYGDMLSAVAYVVAFLFASVLAVFPAIFAVAMSVIINRIGWWAVAFSPLVWVTTEWIRPFVTGVTWNALGISQVDFFQIAKLARFGGAYLISAEIVAVSAILVLLLKFRENNVAFAAAFLVLVGFLAFQLPTIPSQNRWHQIESLQGKSVFVVGIQPNLRLDSPSTPEIFERDLQNSIRLTRDGLSRAPGGKADIVVWAEAPLAIFYENDPQLRERLDNLAKETGSYLIANTATRNGEFYFNSVQTISPRNEGENNALPQSLKRYDKIRLVPFGEYVPWRAALGRFVPAIVGDFTPGRTPVVNLLKLETKSEMVFTGTQGEQSMPSGAIERTTSYVRVGSFVCYEAAYPDLVRQFVGNGASLLVNVSNDAWFGNTAGARQHLAHAKMRAIENDRQIIRVTNSGISALITADGQAVDPLSMFTSGSQVWRAQARNYQTFYSQHGDWFAMSCAFLSIAVLIYALFIKDPLS